MDGVDVAAREVERRGSSDGARLLGARGGVDELVRPRAVGWESSAPRQRVEGRRAVEGGGSILVGDEEAREAHERDESEGDDELEEEHHSAAPRVRRVQFLATTARNLVHSGETARVGGRREREPGARRGGNVEGVGVEGRVVHLEAEGRAGGVSLAVRAGRRGRRVVRRGRRVRRVLSGVLEGGGAEGTPRRKNGAMGAGAVCGWW